MVKDRKGQFCLIWPGHQYMDQSRQHHLQLQHPRPGSTSSDEIKKRSSGYALQWCGINLLGGFRCVSNGHLQLSWVHLHHGRLERQYRNGRYCEHNFIWGKFTSSRPRQCLCSKVRKTFAGALPAHPARI